jgi:hypothetical protein
VIELDKVFWRPGLVPTPVEEWRRVQERLSQQDTWIMDGDLGPYDDLEVRLRAADTVIFLDFSIFRCAWRALRRSRERWDFWRWLLTYRREPPHAPHATVLVLRNPRDIERALSRIKSA